MIQAWIDDRGDDLEDDYTALRILAEKTVCNRSKGISVDLIYQIHSGRKESCSFSSADALVCALGNPLVWITGALAEYYIPMPQCTNPRCGIVLVQDHRGTRTGRHRKFCSDACAVMSYRILRQEAPAADDEMFAFECEFCHDEVQVPRVERNARRRRRACDKPECKKALKAELMRDYRNRHPEYLEEQRARRAAQKRRPAAQAA